MDKGKKPKFFLLRRTGKASGIPNKDQMRFIYKYYPEYSNEPNYLSLFETFYEHALRAEKVKAEKVRAD